MVTRGRVFQSNTFSLELKFLFHQLIKTSIKTLVSNQHLRQFDLLFFSSSGLDKQISLLNVTEEFIFLCLFVLHENIKYLQKSVGKQHRRSSKYQREPELSETDTSKQFGPVLARVRQPIQRISEH